MPLTENYRNRTNKTVKTRFAKNDENIAPIYS